MAGYEVSYGPGYGSGYEKCFDHNRVITDLNSDRPTFKTSYGSGYRSFDGSITVRNHNCLITGW